jgi:hypothetical protein
LDGGVAFLFLKKTFAIRFTCLQLDELNATQLKGKYGHLYQPNEDGEAIGATLPLSTN